MKHQSHSKNIFGKTHQEREAWEFLQEKGTGLLCAMQDRQIQALFLTVFGSSIHVHKHESPIIICRGMLVVRTG
jgi:hypothetical protein